MVLIISDGGILAQNIRKQLDFYNEKYVSFYTDLEAAGNYGKGSVIVGKPTETAVSAAIRDNRIKGVVDCLRFANPGIQAVCGRLNVFYVKYIGIKERPGLKLCMYYGHIADMIKRGNNALIYASAKTVSAIADIVGDKFVNKIYATVEKSTEFDTSAALEYSIPLLNVMETEDDDSADDVAAMLEKSKADILVCDNTVSVDAKAEAAFNLGIPIIITHSMGMEFKCAATTARDAIIAMHSKHLYNKKED